jgi:hypothetical protein
MNKGRNGSSHSSPYFISQDSYSKTLFKYTIFWFNTTDAIYSLNIAKIRCIFSKMFMSREFELKIHIFLGITLCCCVSVPDVLKELPDTLTQWHNRRPKSSEIYSENLKSHTVFIISTKNDIERQFYVEEFVFQTWALSEIWKVLTHAVMTHPILPAYGDIKHIVHNCQ